MQPMQFHQAVEVVRSRDPRFEAGAYFFLKDALDFTLKQVQDANEGASRHVSGQELLEGFRDLALQEFGPMAATLLQEWGIHSCTHVGELVFHLIDAGVFGKQDSDTREDFAEVYDFDKAFVDPFIPESIAARSATPAANRPRQKKKA